MVMHARAEQSSETLLQCMVSWQQMNFSFEQHVYDNDKLLDSYRGILQTRAPNQLRWELQTPQTELIILNGNSMWHYQPELNQAIYSAVEEDNPIYILLRGDISALQDLYDISHTAEPMRYLLQAKSQINDSAYTELTIVLAKNCLLQRIEWRDELDQYIHMQLSARRGTLDAKSFIFEPATGVDVYRH